MIVIYVTFVGATAAPALPAVHTDAKHAPLFCSGKGRRDIALWGHTLLTECLYKQYFFVQAAPPSSVLNYEGIPQR